MILMLICYTKLLICLMITSTSKKDFVLDQTNHLNFKFEIDSKNPSKEKKKLLNQQTQFIADLIKFCYLIKLMKPYIVKLKK